MGIGGFFIFIKNLIYNNRKEFNKINNYANNFPKLQFKQNCASLILIRIEK